MENVTKTLLENGYLIHNSKQISIEINEQIILFEVEDTEKFIIDNKL